MTVRELRALLAEGSIQENEVLIRQIQGILPEVDRVMTVGKRTIIYDIRSNDDFLDGSEGKDIAELKEDIMQIVLWTIAGITAVVTIWFILTYVMKGMEPNTNSLQSMMATKEGREKIAEMIGNRYRAQDEEMPIVVSCPSCEGFGRMVNKTRVFAGAMVTTTGGPICQDCGGTGVKGGLDFVNIDCPSCDGTGVKDGVKCGMCQGTKIVRRDKDGG
jgi:hypothetical protein